MEFKISQDGAGQRLDKYVRRLLPNLPGSAVYKLIRTKKIRVNGVRALENQTLAAGDLVSIREQAVQSAAPRDGDATPRPAKREFEILHEDKHILVVNKPSGLAIHPGSGITGSTLVDQVRAHVGEIPEGEFKPAPAHRLDRETSGVVIVAKTRQAIVRLAEIFTERDTRKIYLTLVSGELDPEGLIDIPLAEHQQSAANKAERGVNLQRAVTRWKRLGYAQGLTLAEVQIETGRTHQIRRHFAAIGHPVLGDSKHGDFPLNRQVRAELGLKRMFLHAARLQLPHPATEQKATFRAPLTEDLMAVLEALGLEPPTGYAPKS